MIYLLLLFEFIIIGTFSIGGGLATLPFLINLANKYPWFDQATLMDMVAISESTPGPIGINMATYAGYVAGGVIGGLIASVSVMITGLIVMILVGRSLERFKNSAWLVKVFYGLRPTIAALIAYAAYMMLKTVITDVTYEVIPILATTLLFMGTITLIFKTKISPIVLIGIAAIIGVFIPL